MQTEKQKERLVELITEFENNKIVRCPKYNDPTCEGCEYDLGDECDKTSILADHLIANNVVVLPLVAYNKSHERYQVIHKGKDGRIFASKLYYTRKDAENTIKERKENDK